MSKLQLNCRFESAALIVSAGNRGSSKIKIGAR